MNGSKQLAAALFLASQLVAAQAVEVKVPTAQSGEPITVQGVGGVPSVSVPGVRIKGDAHAPNVKVSGSGVAVQQRGAKGFTSIHFTGAVDVNLHAGSEEKVVVRAAGSFLPSIKTQVRNAVLEIGPTQGAGSTDTRYAVDVSYVNLKTIVVSGSSDVRIARLAGDRLEVRSSGSGDIHIDQLDVEGLTLNLQGSGNFTAAGRADVQSLMLSGSGDVRGEQLVGRDVLVKLQGSGDATVNASEALRVEISGSGDVRYRGAARVSKSVSGSGSVNPIQ